MKLDKLERLGEAPSYGDMMAYTRKEVIFHPYTSIDDVKAELEGEELLEIHLFDYNKEYRAIASESKRFAGEGFIEHVADFEAAANGPDMKEYVYVEKCMLEKESGGLDILTHFTYSNYDKVDPDSNNGKVDPDSNNGKVDSDSDKGMLVADDYRLRRE